MPTLSAEQVWQIAYDALTHHGCQSEAARSMADSIVATEKMGVSSHGLLYLPIYCQHLDCGKVNPVAKPQLKQTSTTSIRVDADCGFAHPAIDLGFTALIPAARQHGIAALAIHQSYNCGVLGYHVERLAQEGLVGLAFTNAPASIAPIGGKAKVIGTNPIALAVPDGHSGKAAFVLDQSASVVAKSEIMRHAKTDEAIPDHWAFDSHGDPTSDPHEALKGSMAPAGGYKGFGLGLIVETFAAVLSGATLSAAAAPFSGTEGGPPATGQFFMALNPEHFGAAAYQTNLTQLCASITDQPEARLPGSRRQQFRDTQQPIMITEALQATLNGLIA